MQNGARSEIRDLGTLGTRNWAWCTAGIPNWGHLDLGCNRAVKTNRLIFLFPTSGNSIWWHHPGWDTLLQWKIFFDNTSSEYFFLWLVFLDRLLWVYLITLEGVWNVRTSRKSFSVFNEIWYVDRGRWVMHDSMPCNPIQGHGASEVPKIALFQLCFLRHLQQELANDH